MFGSRPGPQPRPSPQPRPAPPGYDAIWHTGEIAECVVSGVWTHIKSNTPSTGPDIGERNRVVGVVAGLHPDLKCRVTLLSFAAYEGWFSCIEFRKVVPHADAAEAADAAFIASLKPARIPGRLAECARFDARRHPLSADPLVSAIAALEQEYARHG